MTSSESCPSTAELVRAAAEGDQAAWSQLVRQFQPLLTAVTRRCGLSAADGEDVSQQVWLKLYHHLGDLREPAALAGWLKTTTRHAALDVVEYRKRTIVVDPQPAAESAGVGTWSRLERTNEHVELDADLLRAELQQAVRAGLAQLTERQRTLLELLAADPPLPYHEISDRLGVPVGAIGPTRGRCFGKLRASEPVSRYVRSVAAAGGAAHAA